MERTMGLSAQPLHQGRAGTYMTAARGLTIAGAVLAAVPPVHRNRLGSILAGASLLAGSAATASGSSTRASSPRATPATPSSAA